MFGSPVVLIFTPVKILITLCVKCINNRNVHQAYSAVAYSSYRLQPLMTILHYMDECM